MPGTNTLVMPRTPMLGLDEVEPLPVPNRPSSTQDTPSMKMPLEGKAQASASTKQGLREVSVNFLKRASQTHKSYIVVIVCDIV